MFELQEEFNRDVLRTLYGAEPQLFGCRFEIEIGFVEEGKPGEIYILTLKPPFGRVVATREEWVALQQRLADKLPGHYRPATAEEIREFQEKEMAMFELARRERDGQRKYDA